MLDLADLYALLKTAIAVNEYILLTPNVWPHLRYYGQQLGLN